MLLVGVRKENGWLLSRWNLTYRVGWEQIRKAAHYNQTNAVTVNVAGMTEEFKEADYEKFNKSLCQYLDSIELAMYR